MSEASAFLDRLGGESIAAGADAKVPELFGIEIETGGAR
jgi:hypothetical protein